ncbi:hypothetical protein G3M48_007370 [Beauveria asiatica]|uniref:Uncharacterized protein n=1 Tax=Beauveria asiatica TaxID=1069075 RepID=A0AAW0RM96_9HYPO
MPPAVTAILAELDEWDDVKEQRVADGQATRRVEELDPKNAANSWLQRVGWTRHLEGLQVEELQQFAKDPDEDEALLQHMTEQCHQALEEAYKTCRSYRIGGFMHAVLQEARSIMTELAMCGEGGIGESPAIAWNDVYDDNSNDSVGYSFIKDDRNTSWVVQGKGYIKRQLVRCNRQQKAWLRRVDAPGVGPAQGGQPARATEILTIQMEKTANGRTNFQQTDQVKIIHRFMPPEVGELWQVDVPMVLACIMGKAATFRPGQATVIAAIVTYFL